MTKLLTAIALGATLTAGVAFGQATPPAPPTGSPTLPLAPAPLASTPPVTAPIIVAPAVTDDAKTPPLAGANSFSMEQARQLMEEKGFTAVSDLRKDARSIWRATAVKDGASKLVALDFKGNVTAE